MTAEKIGRYEVKSELGRGGMATVFLAHDPLIGRDVAVKVLPREFLHDPSFRGRFEREARTVAMLEHPAIVPIYDFGEQGDQPYLVMRYMKGGTLGDLVKKGPLPVAEAAEILKRLGSALDHAHSRGVIHRDLKPGNILFDEYGNAFLSDFGIVKLAQATAALTGTSIIGTPAYMSPEQVHGDKEIDSRSDIYTLGVILFEMVTGQMPYRAETPAKLMMAHVLNPIPRVRDVRPDLPSGCETVISQALAKAPDARFRTAGELAEALSKTLESESLPQERAQERQRTMQPVTDSEASASQPAIERRRPVTPPVPTPSDQRVTPPPPSGTEGTGTPKKQSRFLLAALGVAGLLAFCCGGIFLLSLLLGDESSISGTATTSTGVVLGDGTPEENVTPDEQLVSNTAATAESATAKAQAAQEVATERAQAQVDAIATRVAESTATAEVRLAATATAYAPTRAAEQAIQAVLDAQQNDPLFGPAEGLLVHVADGFVKTYYADVNVRNFVVEAVFQNPYAATTGSWDIGYAFRETAINSQYRLAVESNGEWSLSDRRGDDTTYISSGQLNNLNRDGGQANRLTIYARDDVGYFFVNGQFVAQLDLSSRSDAGDIGVATSMFTGNEIEGEETGYEEFTIWSPDA